MTKHPISEPEFPGRSFSRNSDRKKGALVCNYSVNYIDFVGYTGKRRSIRGFIVLAAIVVDCRSHHCGDGTKDEQTAQSAVAEHAHEAAFIGTEGKLFRGQ